MTEPPPSNSGGAATGRPSTPSQQPVEHMPMSRTATRSERPVEWSKISDEPVPVWLLDNGVRNPPGVLSPRLEEPDLGDDFMTLGLDWPGHVYSCVRFSQLGNVLRTGLAVPEAPYLWVADFSKAWEYGGPLPKLLLAYDTSALDSTHREVPADTPAEDIDLLRRAFPTLLESVDRSQFWLSRFEPDAPYLASSYEINYARWIPGDPFDALSATVVCSDGNDYAVRAAVNELVAANGEKATP